MSSSLEWPCCVNMMGAEADWKREMRIWMLGRAVVDMGSKTFYMSMTSKAVLELAILEFVKHEVVHTDIWVTSYRERRFPPRHRGQVTALILAAVYMDNSINT